MNGDSGVARVVTRALLTGVVALTLATGAAALAQDASPADEAAVTRATDAAAVADQPRRARDRRRAAAQAADETRAAETAVAAPASTDAAPATLAAQAGETVEARMMCKNVKLTGTKISRRICGTPEQWAAKEQKTTDDAQEAMRQVRDRSSIVVSQPQSPLGGLGGGN